MLSLPGKMDDSTYKDLPRLGWLVWNEVGSIDQTWDEAKDILTAHGFEKALLPVTTEKKAFILALDSIRSMGRSASVRVFSRPVVEDAVKVRYQVTVEVVQNKERLAYDSKVIVDFDKKSNEVTFLWPDIQAINDDLESEIREAYARYRDRVYHWTLGRFATEDISRCDGVAVRPKGGVWFVPDVHSERVGALEKTFDSFGNGSRFYKHPVLDTSTWRANILKFAEDDMQQQITELEREFEAFKDAYKGQDVSLKSLQSRLNNYQTVREKVRVYEELLAFNAKNIRGKVEELESRITAVLRGEVPGLTPVEKKKRRGGGRRRKERPVKVKAQGETRILNDKEVPF